MTTVLLILAVLGLVVWTSRHFALNRAKRDEPFIRADVSAGPPVPAPLVSVLIPARNEQANLPRCLAALLSQDYPAFEVIVLDDRSDDDTARIIAETASCDPRVRLARIESLPKGWTGKNQIGRASWRGRV